MDEAMENNKLDNHDDTNDVSDKRKHLYLRKQDLMKSLHPYIVKNRLSNEEYKLFSNLFLNNVWDLQYIYESQCKKNLSKMHYFLSSLV